MQHVQACSPCQELRASNPKRPIQEQTVPTGPMSDVSADLCEYRGKDYLVAACRYSGWPFIAMLKKTDTEAVTKELKHWFNTFGWPTNVRTDGGPQFRSAEFHKFCSDAGVNVQTSSPYNAQSNGHAEAAVKTMKAIVVKCARTGTEIEGEVTHFRATPRSDGVSPAQLMLGRNIRTRESILAAHPSYTPQGEPWNSLAEKRSGWLEEKRNDYNSRAANLTDQLLEGTPVRIQNTHTKNWDKTGKIIKKNADRDSYIVQSPEGRLFTRNRKYLRPAREENDPNKSQDQDTEEHQSTTESPIRRSNRLAEKASPSTGLNRKCQLLIAISTPSAHCRPSRKGSGSWRSSFYNSRNVQSPQLGRQRGDHQPHPHHRGRLLPRARPHHRVVASMGPLGQKESLAQPTTREEAPARRHRRPDLEGAAGEPQVQVGGHIRPPQTGRGSSTRLDRRRLHLVQGPDQSPNQRGDPRPTVPPPEDQASQGARNQHSPQAAASTAGTATTTGTRRSKTRPTASTPGVSKSSCHGTTPPARRRSGSSPRTRNSGAAPRRGSSSSRQGRSPRARTNGTTSSASGSRTRRNQSGTTARRLPARQEPRRDSTQHPRTHRTTRQSRSSRRNQRGTSSPPRWTRSSWVRPRPNSKGSSPRPSVPWTPSAGQKRHNPARPRIRM